MFCLSFFIVLELYFKTCVFFAKFLFFHQMIALQKL